ncbi:MAG: hypothetical protein GY838_13115 [bacterium]|nr:hypothetical protein [bacterium]
MATEKKKAKGTKAKGKKALPPPPKLLPQKNRSVLEPPPMTMDEVRALGVEDLPAPKATHELRDLQVTSVQLTKEVVPGGGYVCEPGPAPEQPFEVSIDCPTCRSPLSDGLCSHCGEKGLLSGRVVFEPALTPDQVARFFEAGSKTDLQVDHEVIGAASSGPWEVGSGYEQSDPGTFVAGQGLIIAAEQDDTDCVLRESDAVFMARARNRWPALVDSAIELQFGFAELVRRYREWAGMKSCTPAVRELLRRISSDIEGQIRVFDCERTGESFVARTIHELEEAQGMSSIAQRTAKRALDERDELREERDLLSTTRDESMEIIGELKAEVQKLNEGQALLLQIKLEYIAELGDYLDFPENYPAIQAHDEWQRKNR